MPDGTAPVDVPKPKPDRGTNTPEAGAADQQQSDEDKTGRQKLKDLAHKIGIWRKKYGRLDADKSLSLVASEQVDAGTATEPKITDEVKPEEQKMPDPLAGLHPKDREVPLLQRLRNGRKEARYQRALGPINEARRTGQISPEEYARQSEAARAAAYGRAPATTETATSTSSPTSSEPTPTAEPSGEQPAEKTASETVAETPDDTPKPATTDANQSPADTAETPFDKLSDIDKYTKIVTDLWEKRATGAISQENFDRRLARANEVYKGKLSDTDGTGQPTDIDPREMYKKIEADLRKQWKNGEITEDQFKDRVRRAQDVREEGRPEAAYPAPSESPIPQIPDTADELLRDIDGAKAETPNPADLLEVSGITAEELAHILSSDKGKALAEAMQDSPEAAKSILAEIQKGRQQLKEVCESLGWPYDDKDALTFSLSGITRKLKQDLDAQIAGGADTAEITQKSKFWAILKALAEALIEIMPELAKDAATGQIEALLLTAKATAENP